MKKFMELKKRFCNWLDNLGKAKCLIEVNVEGKVKYEWRRYDIDKQALLEVLENCPNEKLILYNGEIINEPCENVELVTDDNEIE